MVFVVSSIVLVVFVVSSIVLVVFVVSSIVLVVFVFSRETPEAEAEAEDEASRISRSWVALNGVKR